MRIDISGGYLFRLGEFCTFRIKHIRYMKYLLTILIVSALSCKKSSDDNARQEPPANPTATGCSCQTIWYGPSISNIFWSVTLNVPDTNAVSSLTLRYYSTMAPVFVIEKPKSKTYSQIKEVNRVCSGAYYFFEWKMADGSIKKEDPVMIRE